MIDLESIEIEQKKNYIKLLPSIFTSVQDAEEVVETNVVNSVIFL